MFSLASVAVLDNPHTHIVTGKPLGQHRDQNIGVEWCPSGCHYMCGSRLYTAFSTTRSNELGLLLQVEWEMGIKADTAVSSC